MPLRLLYRRHALPHDLRRVRRATSPRTASRPSRSTSGYIGVELEAFEPGPSLRTPEPTLLYLGRLKRYKRIELVLDALERDARERRSTSPATATTGTSWKPRSRRAAWTTACACTAS